MNELRREGTLPSRDIFLSLAAYDVRTEGKCVSDNMWISA